MSTGSRGTAIHYSSHAEQIPASAPSWSIACGGGRPDRCYQVTSDIRNVTCGNCFRSAQRQVRQATPRCGDTQQDNRDGPTYRCRLDAGHTGDHMDTRHPMGPYWPNTSAVPALHSAQPWTATYDDTGGYDCTTAAWVIRNAHHKIAAVDLSDYGQPNCGDIPPSAAVQAEADAALIAAAPELRDALEMAYAALRQCSEEAGDTPFWNAGGDGYAAATTARALLARLGVSL